MDINLNSCVLGMKYCIPEMKKSKQLPFLLVFLNYFFYHCHKSITISVIYAREEGNVLTALNTSKENVDLAIKAIVEQVQSGDVHTYTEIIRSFQKQIYIYCYYLLGSKEEAEDAVQDIFIKGLKNIRNFSYTVSFSAWLYKIAHHHCMDLLKKKNKSYKFWTNFKQEQAYEQSHRQAYEYDDFIHELLEKLTMDERRILLLRSIEEYSFDEIASIMELKPTTVRKKYERLRKKLLKEKKLGGDIYGHSIKTGG